MSTNTFKNYQAATVGNAYVSAYTPGTVGWITRSTTVATVTLPVKHGLAVGDTFLIAGTAGAPFDGLYTVASVTSAYIFTYTVANSGVTTTTAGTITYSAKVSPIVTALSATQTVIYSVSVSNNLTSSITVSAGVGTIGTSSASWLSRTGTTVTVTWPTTHGFSAGDWVVISNSGQPSFDGAFQIDSVPTGSTFTYTSGTSGSTTSSAGTGYRMSYHVKDATVAPGNAIVVLGADQKCNLNYSGTSGLNQAYVVYSNTSISASAIASVLEIT